MALKKIRPRESALEYDPRTRELVVVSELRFGLDNAGNAFELDQNPAGEAAYTPLSRVEASGDFSRLTFDAIYRGRETTFQLDSEHACDRVLYQLLTQIDDGSYRADNGDQGIFQLVFKAGALYRANFFRQSGTAIVDSMTLLLEDAGYVLIRQGPYRISTLNTLEVEDGTIRCVTDEETVAYVPGVQEYIFATLKALLEASMRA